MPPAIDERGRRDEGDQGAEEGAEAAAGAEEGEAKHRSVPQVRQLLGDFVGAGSLERAGDPSVGEQDDAVGVGRRDGVVGDHHDRVAVGVDELAQEREHAAPGAGVERSGGLVGEDHLGPCDERAGDRDALLLAAGELGGTVAQARSPSPTRAATSRTSERRARRPSRRSGRPMFWATVSDGIRLKAWKTNPTARAGGS